MAVEGGRIPEFFQHFLANLLEEKNKKFLSLMARKSKRVCKFFFAKVSLSE